MGFWSSVTTDIKINSTYGDIEIVGGDLVLNKNTQQILKDVIIERFKTNSNDFLLYPDYGADLDSYLGKGIDLKLLEDITTSLRYSLTYDNYLNNNEVSVVGLLLNNSIKLYVYVVINEQEVKIVTATYNKEGLSFD